MGRLRFFLSSIFRAVFGSVQWAPPGWLLFCCRRRVLAVVLLLAGITGGAAQWYRSQEANRARPRELVATRKVMPTAQAIPIANWDPKAEKVVAVPLLVTF